MTRRSLGLFFICVAIWSTTWLAIKFQLGTVAPEVSVGWRFGLAAIACGLICLYRGDRLRFDLKVHAELFALGMLMFCVSYIFVYWAETYVVSGLVAVGYSASPLLNMAVSRVMLRTPMTARIAAGGTLGLAGVCLIYGHEFMQLRADTKPVLGVLFTAGAVLVSSVANAFATRASQQGVNVWQKMTWGMAYGAAGCFIWALLQGKSLMPLFTLTYTLPLLYLALAGSVLTFAAYFALMAREGAAVAGYVGVMTPIAALALSAWFEQYHFTVWAALGIGMALAGNVLIIRQPAK
jgi:drug/metabolite transporter (DMT)-like permease